MFAEHMQLLPELLTFPPPYQRPRFGSARLVVLIEIQFWAPICEPLTLTHNTHREEKSRVIIVIEDVIATLHKVLDCTFGAQRGTNAFPIRRSIYVRSKEVSRQTVPLPSHLSGRVCAWSRLVLTGDKFIQRINSPSTRRAVGYTGHLHSSTQYAL